LLERYRSLTLKGLIYFEDGDLLRSPKETRDGLDRSGRDTPVGAIHLISPHGGIAP